MCIIAYIPKGVKMPSEAILKTMFINNPDGGGFAYINNNQVQIVKGLMSYDHFVTELQKALNKVPTTQSPYLLHFRITTQGGTRASNCHPFPSSSKLKRLKQTRATTKIAIAHNGIIPSYSNYKWGATTSDTMDFIQDFASPLIDNNTKWHEGAKGRAIVKALQAVAQSKLAILGNDGHCELIGQFNEFEGVLYSNYSYNPKTYTHQTTFDWKYDQATQTWQKAPTQKASKQTTYNKQNCPFEIGDYTKPMACYNCTDFASCYKFDDGTRY